MVGHGTAIFPLTLPLSSAWDRHHNFGMLLSLAKSKFVLSEAPVGFIWRGTKITASDQFSRALLRETPPEYQGCFLVQGELSLITNEAPDVPDEFVIEAAESIDRFHAHRKSSSSLRASKSRLITPSISTSCRAYLGRFSTSLFRRSFEPTSIL